MDNRQIDALVAEKVMGLISGPIVEIIGGKAVNGRGDSVILPYYSEEIKAAWQVVTKLESRYCVTISTPSVGNKYHCSIGLKTDEFIEKNFPPSFSAWGESAPLTICLAALKAAGVEIE